MHDIYDNIRFPRDREETSRRPYVFLNMVHSADGRAAVEGKASGLGTDVDRSVMRTLRSKADAVLVGGGTIRAEKLSLGLDTADVRPVPLAVILTSSGDLPLQSNLVLDHRQDILVLLPDSAEKNTEKRLAHHAETRRVPATRSGTIDVRRALEILKLDYGTDVLLCEGGPALNRTLMEANMVDEAFLTIAPILVGAGSKENSAPAIKKRLRLISLHTVGDELFLRYAMQGRQPKA